jgi:integrase/recombinase XerD
VAPPDDAQSSRPVPLPGGRLDRLVRQVAALYRKAHLTAVEARYVHKRARARAGIRGRPRSPRRLPEILSPEELSRILAQAYREQPRHGLIVRTLFETGLRVSELCHLQAADVDFLERTIRVREGKGGKDRLVLFTPDLGQQLRLHLDGRERGALFESNRARPYSVRMIQHVVKAVARKAGVEKKISPHTYRHSMATFLRNQGVPLDVVQLLLGHQNPRTTQLYARLSLATAREEYDRAMRGLGEPSAPVSRHTETAAPTPNFDRGGA